MKKYKETEIRPCVVLFAEILGLEELLTRLEPEEYGEILKDIFNQLDEAVDLYQGHVDKHKEKTLMATFGVPVAHEDDPERAVRSALLMTKKIDEYSKEKKLSIQLRIGMNLGRVCAGDVGSVIKQEYTVMGTVVNIAAKIIEAAKESQILIGEELYHNTRPVFEFSNPIKFTIPGAKDEITVYNVLRLKSGFIKRRGIEGLQSPLVGRDRELKTLSDCLLELLVDKKGRVLIISGEAGVGKSRLIEELFTHSLAISLEQAKIINWCSSRCSAYKETTYFPFIELIKQMCGIETIEPEAPIAAKLLSTVKKLTDGKSDDIYPYIANLFSLPLSPSHQIKIKHLEPKEIKLQTHISISSLLRSYALVQPTVYCIDDLHLADMAMLEAIRFFLETSPDIPALILLIARPETEKPFWKVKNELEKGTSITELVLSRLSPDATKEISKNLLKISRLPKSLFDDIVTKAEGNPFFLEEIIKLLISKGILYKKGSEWCAASEKVEFTIPYTIEGIIRTRLDTMTQKLKGLLEEMAIIGRNFSIQILKNFTNYWEDLNQLITELRELGFISTNNTQDFSFNHALIREIIYTTLTKKRLRELHLKVANTIETIYKDRLAEFHEILFDHYRQASEQDKAISYGKKAGDNARDRYANTEAIYYYSWILEVLERSHRDNELQREILENLGPIYKLVGQHENAFAAYNRALQLCTEDRQSAGIYKKMADTYESISDYKKAVEYYEKARSLLSDRPNEEKMGIILGLTWVSYLKGNYNEACETLENTLKSITDTASIETRRHLANLYNRLGSVYDQIGKTEESFAAHNKALKLFELLDDMAGTAVIYNNIHGYYTRQGDYFRGLEYLKKSLDIDLKTGNLLGYAIATYNVGLTLQQLGNIEQAETQYYEYLKINSQINNRLGNGYGNWGLGQLAVERNELAKAKKYFDSAFEIFKELGSKILEMNVSLSIVDYYIIKGDYEEAYRLWAKVYEDAQKINNRNLVVDCLMVEAKLKVFRSLRDKATGIKILREAKGLFLTVKDHFEKTLSDQETKFEVYFWLSMTSYHLGEKEEAIKFYMMAKNIQTEILKFISPDNAQKKFLSKRMYRDFKTYNDEELMFEP